MLNEEQKKEGYWIEEIDDRVLVWHNKNQIALLYKTSDIVEKVQDVVERRREQLRSRGGTCRNGAVDRAQTHD